METNVIPEKKNEFIEDQKIMNQFSKQIMSQNPSSNIQANCVIINNYNSQFPVLYPQPSYPSMYYYPQNYYFNQFYGYPESYNYQMPVNDMIYNVKEIEQMMKEQQGCRNLQQKIEEGDQIIINELLKLIKTKPLEYMMHPFCNYLCQKIFEITKLEILIPIFQSISKNFLQLCLSIHGTRALQKLIIQLAKREDLKIEISSCLKGYVSRIAMDSNGNHVIQMALNILGKDFNNFIFLECKEMCKELAMHKYGCCVLQKCIDYGTSTQRNMIISELLRHKIGRASCRERV